MNWHLILGKVERLPSIRHGEVGSHIPTETIHPS